MNVSSSLSGNVLITRLAPLRNRRFLQPQIKQVVFFGKNIWMVLGMENFDKKSLRQHFKKSILIIQPNTINISLSFWDLWIPVLFKNFCYINICTWKWNNALYSVQKLRSLFDKINFMGPRVWILEQKLIAN